TLWSPEVAVSPREIAYFPRFLHRHDGCIPPVATAGGNAWRPTFRTRSLLFSPQGLPAMVRPLFVSLIVFCLTATAHAESRIGFIARVILRSPDAQYTSTGILIRRDLILTNHHAIR